MEKFRILKVIGEGTYGKVFKAQEKETGVVVAIKKFKQREDEDPHVRKTMMREIRILRQLPHVNIVNLREVFREKGKLFLVFDYIQRTLLEELQAKPDGLPFQKVKSIIYQILKATNYLHEGKIIHRDIKPENLLISKAGVIKLCDFGFARPLNTSPTYQYTDYVSTRWYRAPELLVGDAAYSGTVDVWAIGCIFAEIFNGQPLFPGDSDLHTLQLILETVSADDIENEQPIQELSKKQRVAFRMNPLFENMKVPLAKDAIKAPETVKEVSIKALLKNIDDIQLDFIRRCLVIDGGSRATLAELLEHPIFDEEFRTNYDDTTEQMTEQDRTEMEKLSKEQLTTNDGRPELGPEELVTEDEKDDDDDDDEFDDDDSSSAVGSPGTTSGVTPDSSSGVGHNNMYEHLHIERDRGESYNEQSVNTAVPPYVGDGIVHGDSQGLSADNLLAQNSIVSINTSQKVELSVDQAASNESEADGRTKVLLMTSKNLDIAPTETQTALRTQETPNQASILTSPKNPGSPVKEVKNLRNGQSAEQLQIAKGVNGTTLLYQVDATHELTQDEAEAYSSVPPTEPHNIEVKVSGSPVKDYHTKGGQETQPQQLQEHISATPSKAKKRTSLNHYMVESSITEEIKEENYSEKTSSDNKSSTSNLHPEKNGTTVISGEDHVIVREGVTSIFTHNQSRPETEACESGESGPSAASPQIGAGSDLQIVLSANKNQNQDHRLKGAKNGGSTDDGKNGTGLTSGNSMTETKITSGQYANQSITGRPNSMEEVPALENAQVSRAQTLVSSTGSQGLTQNPNNLNQMELKQQHTENLANQVYRSNEQNLMNQQAEIVGQTAQHAGSKSKSGAAGGAPQISKVNITFGASQSSHAHDSTGTAAANGKAHNSLLNLQMTNGGVQDQTSRQSSINNASVVSAGTTSLLAQQIMNGAPIQGAVSTTSQGQTESAMGLKPTVGNASSRAVVNNLNNASQKSSISLKQIHAVGMNQTAREFTPNKKPSLVAPFPQTIQQHSFGIEGSGIRQMTGNGMDSTAAKSSLGRSGPQNPTGLYQQEMSVTQFSGKPIYQVQQYPKTQIKGPGPKQTAVLKQTTSLEKFENRHNISPSKLPNLKPINSSMSSYGQSQVAGGTHKNGKVGGAETEQRVGEGLVGFQANSNGIINRQGPNSLTSHFSSHQQRYTQQTSQGINTSSNVAVGSSINNGGKMTSGSTQSLKTKMNFTSQNYHRASNSQSNEPPHALSHGKSNKLGITTIANSIAANSAKKSQLIQPLKLVAFPKITEHEHSSVGQASPSQSINGVATTILNTGQGSHTLTSTIVNGKASKGSTGGGIQQQTNMFTKSKAAPIQKKMGPVQMVGNPQSNQLSSKTQTSKMPKRYSDMGMTPNGSLGNNQKFVNNIAQNNKIVVQPQVPEQPTFHPSLTNEYMLSQDSLGLGETNSRPSRQSSKTNLEQIQVSVENRARNQAPSHMSSNQKPPTTSHGPIPNQSFHSTMKSKNSKFIQQNSSTSKGVISVNSSNPQGITNVGKTGSGTAQPALVKQYQPPNTSDKKIHQHFLEEFSEATSQRHSIARGKNTAESQSNTVTKTPMTSLFQKSKFFQSSTSNAENNNPNSMSSSGPPAYNHHQQLSNHYGQAYQHQQSSSPNRTLNQPSGSGLHHQEVNITSNFTEKDGFPRRNITNKLRNASNVQHKKTTNKFTAHQQAAAHSLQDHHHASVMSSPSPLSFHQRRADIKGQNTTGGIVLPNLSQNQTAANPAQSSTTAQQHIMQVSLTQLRTTAEQNRNGNHLSQSPNIKSSKGEALVSSGGLGGQKLSAAANVVQLNASEFNLRLTNNSQLSGGKGQAMPYQQIVRKPPSVIQPGRAHQYQMYLTPSQNYTSSTNQSVGVGRGGQKNANLKKDKVSGTGLNQTKGGNGSSPTALSKKISYENSFHVQKLHGGPGAAGGGQHRSPGLNAGTVSYKVKTETDWHRGSQQQLFEVNQMGSSGPNQGQSNPNQLYRVSNQFLEKSISPQRIHQAMKRGSNVQIISSQKGIGVMGASAANHSENKINFSNQQERRRKTGGATLEGSGAAMVSGSNMASTGVIHDSSQDSLPVQSPNLLRKKFISKQQQNQIK